MKMGLSGEEGAVLHGILEETAGDIVIRLNAQGFIEHGSGNLAILGFDLSQLLLPPHVAELADSQFSGQISRHFEAVMRGEGRARSTEFRAKTCAPYSDCAHSDCVRWYALSLKPLVNANAETCGALGLLRSIERLRSLEDELFAKALTDPVTGLVNRSVFLARLRNVLQDGAGGALALFTIDRIRALTLQYGRRAADDINWGFAKFLQAMASPESELAQLDGERFAVMLPGMPPEAARRWIEDVLETFSTLALPASGKSPRLSASAGLARIEASVDTTMREAEVALVMACAGGGGRLAQSGQSFASSNRDITANCDAWDDELGDRALPR